jgi:hypothetical protein
LIAADALASAYVIQQKLACSQSMIGSKGATKLLSVHYHHLFTRRNATVEVTYDDNDSSLVARNGTIIKFTFAGAKPPVSRVDHLSYPDKMVKLISKPNELPLVFEVINEKAEANMIEMLVYRGQGDAGEDFWLGLLNP